MISSGGRGTGSSTTRRLEGGRCRRDLSVPYTNSSRAKERPSHRSAPRDGSPLRKPPEGRVRYPPCKLNTTAKYRRQDEPFVRSTTLNVYLTLHQNTLIYAIRGIGRGFSHYLLCSRELLLHLDPNYSYDIPHGRG